MPFGIFSLFALFIFCPQNDSYFVVFNISINCNLPVLIIIGLINSILHDFWGRTQSLAYIVCAKLIPFGRCGLLFLS